jgi:hypothetical protein
MSTVTVSPGVCLRHAYWPREAVLRVPLRALCKAPSTPSRVHVLHLCAMWGSYTLFTCSHHRRWLCSSSVEASVLAPILRQAPLRRHVGTSCSSSADISHSALHYANPDPTPASMPVSSDSRWPDSVLTRNLVHLILQWPSLASQILLERLLSSLGVTGPCSETLSCVGGVVTSE